MKDRYVRKWIEIFECNKKKYSYNLYKNNFYKLDIDVNDILEYDFEFYEEFLCYPEYIMSSGEHAMREVLGDYENDLSNVSIRIYNLPDTEESQLNLIRKDSLNTLVKFKGMLKKKSVPYIKTVSLKYCCTNPACVYSETQIVVPQKDESIQKLKSCPRCKSQVELAEEEDQDIQNYVIEEMSEDLPNPNIQPMNKIVEIYGDLTNPEINNNLPMGTKVEVIGYVKKRKKKNQNKEQSIGEFYIEAQNIVPLEEKIYDISVSNSEYEKILNLSQQDDTKDIILNSIAPQLRGMRDTKLGVLLSLLGGTKEDTRQRDNIHILIVGDPSLGKSKLLNYINELMPRTKYVSGEGSTGSGLTAVAQKDELTGSWSAEAGAIVQANNGQLLIDELDKIPLSEQTKLNTALESGRVVLDKASVSVDLNANSSVIACANPKYGQFDKYMDYGSQIKIDSALRTRFDLIFVMEDIYNEEDDMAIADSIFDVGGDDSLDMELLRKYIISAKNLHPQHTTETAQMLKDYYLQLRKVTEGDKMKITIRQLDGLKRLSEAHAKLHMREEVTKEDCQAVIELMNRCHKKFGVYEQNIGTSFNNMNKKKALNMIIDSMGDRIFTIEDIKSKLNSSDYSDKDILNHIEKLKNEAEIYEPRKAQYKKLL